MLEFTQNQNKGEAEKLGKFKEKTTQLFFKANKELKRNKNTVVFAPGASNDILPGEIGKSTDNNQISKAIFGLKNIGNTCNFIIFTNF